MERPLSFIVSGRSSILQAQNTTADLERSRSSRSWHEVLPSNKALPLDHEVRVQITEAISRFIPEREPRPGQIEALYQLVYGDSDVLMQAGTGYGKSMIFQLASSIVKHLRNIDSTTIMISPLNSLTEQQVENLQRLASSPGPKIKGVAVTGHSSGDMKKLFDDIGARKYTHICISPELVCSRQFRVSVIENPEFRAQQIFFVIDEAHCIVQWSTFRREYGKFGPLRLSLGREVRVFGTSATLGPLIQDSVLRQGPFQRRNLTFINTTVDRPEIFIDIRFMEASKRNLEDLHWLIPKTVNDEDLPCLRKTLVFFDSRRLATQAWTYLRTWLHLGGATRSTIDQTVQLYHALLSPITKETRFNNFRAVDSPIRILCATDAVGMGVDLDGVELVVQYGGDDILRDISELTTLIQRMGRAARNSGERAAFVWIVENWVKWPPNMQLPNLSQWKDIDLSRFRPESIDPNQTARSSGQNEQIAARGGRRRGKTRSQGRGRITTPVLPLLADTSTGISSGQVSLPQSTLSATMNIDGNTSTALEKRRLSLHPIYQLMLWDCPRRAIWKASYSPDSLFWRLPEYLNDTCCSFEHPGKRPISLSTRTPTQHVTLLRQMKKLDVAQVSEANRELLLKLSPSFPLRGPSKYIGAISNTLKRWREDQFAKLIKYQSRLKAHLLLSDDSIERIATMNVWLIGNHGEQILQHFVPAFCYPQYINTLIQIVTETVQQEPLSLFPVRQYRRQEKVARSEEAREILRSRGERRIQRYGTSIPTSEVPGDLFDRQDQSKRVSKSVRIPDIAQHIGRVDNQDPVWSTTQLSRTLMVSTQSEADAQESATSVATDQSSQDEEPNFIDDSELTADNETSAISFSSTASTVVELPNTPGIIEARNPVRKPKRPVNQSIQRLQRQYPDKDRSGTPPPQPILRQSRSGRTIRPTQRLIESSDQESLSETDFV